jgi:hypothetical protein
MDQKEDQIADDIVFIFDECKRILDMGRDVFKHLPADEALFDLPHPSGQGKMLCGRAAAVRIEALATEAGRRTGISRRVEYQTLIKATKDLLVQRFLKEKRDLSRSQIDRFFSAIHRRAGATCTDLVQLIPCTLMTEQEPETIVVGPITFRNRASFRKVLISHLKNFQRDVTEEWKKEYSRSIMADAARFYRQFDWVAEVTISRCDPKTSRIVAERAVTSALDCLHLLFRAKHTYRMRVGGPALRTDSRAHLAISKDGKISSGTSREWAGQGNFPKGWSEQLSDPVLAFMLSLCGVALRAAIDPDAVRPISRRFLDAAQWFGEASRDDRPATQVVKYVTALERMVMTDEKDDIAKTVAERVAALCCDPKVNDRQKWRDDVHKIYDLRSRLVHGSLSPSDPTIESGAWLAACIGEEALMHALGSLGKEALETEQVSTKRLANWFTGVIDAVDRMASSVDQE